MFKKINLDHCYNEDPNFKFFKKLGKMGFNLEPGVVEHPGKAFCKLLRSRSAHFPSGACGDNKYPPDIYFIPFFLFLD